MLNSEISYLLVMKLFAIPLKNSSTEKGFQLFVYGVDLKIQSL